MSFIRTSDSIDAALIAAGLKVDNPLSQEGLFGDLIPAGLEVIEILNTYDVNTEVPCSVCPQRQPHKRGATLLFKGGVKAICGQNCLDTYYGKGTWDLHNQRHELKRDYVIQSERIKPLRQNIDSAYHISRRWYAAISQASAFRKQFSSDYNNLFDKLTHVFEKEDGKLLIYPRRSLPSDNPILLGGIKGGNFLLKDPHDLFSNGWRKLHKATELLKQDSSAVTEFNKILELVKDGHELVMFAVRTYSSAIAFCTKDNMRNIAEWAENNNLDYGWDYASSKTRVDLRQYFVEHPDKYLVVPILESLDGVDEVDSLLLGDVKRDELLGVNVIIESVD